MEQKKFGPCAARRCWLLFTIVKRYGQINPSFFRRGDTLFFYVAIGTPVLDLIPLIHKFCQNLQTGGRFSFVMETHIKINGGQKKSLADPGFPRRLGGGEGPAILAKLFSEICLKMKKKNWPMARP